MNVGSPILDVSPTARGALLHALALLQRPVTRRQLAVAANVAPGNASSVIADLIESGLVHETVAGRASLVSLNREHLAAAPVIALAGLRGELIRRLRKRIGDWPSVRGAWLFGSVARGEADSGSDIDVLIIAEDLQSADFNDRLAQLHADVQSWTGNDLQVVEHSPQAWRKLIREMNALVAEIRRDGVLLAGDEQSLLERRR